MNAMMKKENRGMGVPMLNLLRPELSCFSHFIFFEVILQ